MNRHVLHGSEPLPFFARRWLAAREFCIGFRGTSCMAVPELARIAGAERPISTPADSTIAHDVINLWLDDDYGLRQVAHPVRTVVDIGANVGLFSMLARHRFPAATIHAYEPDPVVLEFTERNLSAIDVSLYREGVASMDGRGEVVRLGSTRLNQINPVEDGSVRLTRLETVMARIGGEIGLLKLDCEGFEWDIFRGEAAFARVRTIRMEYHLIDGHTLEDLFAVTNRLGFRRTHLRCDDGFGIAWFDRDPARAKKGRTK